MSNQHHLENDTSQQSSRTGKSPLFSHTSVGNRLYLQVADSLAQLIMTNNLSPGDRLPPERELAQVYEVSRQTIREALIALEVLHLVSIKPGSGVYVQNNKENVPALTIEEPPGYLEVVEALSHFAGEAAFLATQRASNEELLRLNVYIKKIAELAEQQQFADIAEYVSNVHQLIAAASRNMIVESTTKWLWQLYDNTSVQLTELIKKPVQEPVQEQTYEPVSEQEPESEHAAANMSTTLFSDSVYCQKFISCYQEIYQLMSRRDADAARNTMREHLRYLSEYAAINRAC